MYAVGVRSLGEESARTKEQSVTSPECYLRAAVLEMRTAEEPLKANLDVAGIKAQVLGRIEVLEEREREREELLTEVVLAMETRGHNTGRLRQLWTARMLDANFREHVCH